MKQSIDRYFQEARSWSEDIYIEAIASRNRYRFAFLWCMALLFLCLVSFILLLPLQHTQFIIMHHMDDGTIWAEESKTQKMLINQAQIESDIVRYIVNRESYSISDYDNHYRLIHLLSNELVSAEYQSQQSAHNLDSPINQFKNRIVRTCRVLNIIFMNKNSKNPLAQVNFILTDHDRVTGIDKKQSWLGWVSWEYRGTPKDPNSKWLNWNGFTVTRYSVQQSNI